MTDAAGVVVLAVAAPIFFAELTDKDALLLLGLAARRRARTVFLAGATAFTMTSAVIVVLGALATTVIPILPIKVGGGVAMLAFGLWEARGLLGAGAVEEEERFIERERGGLRAFMAMVLALAVLDLAGDATEVLTIVFVAQYGAPLLVFLGAVAGLLAATAVETTLGNRIGRLLTPSRIRLVSAVLFVALGAGILVAVLAW